MPDNEQISSSPEPLHLRSRILSRIAWLELALMPCRRCEDATKCIGENMVNGKIIGHVSIMLMTTRHASTGQAIFICSHK